MRFFQLICCKIKGNKAKLCQERFRLNIRKKIFTERILKHLDRLARDVVKSSSLEVFERWVYVTLRDMDLVVLH